MAKFKKIIKKNSEKLLIETFIKLFIKLASKKEKLKKRFSFVLTGGESPINLYKELSKADVNWKNIDFFWGDERIVSKNSINSNYNLVNKFLFNNNEIKKKQVFSIKTNLKDMSLIVRNYENSIKNYFKKKLKSFDLIILGMGNDGHIASIFFDDKKIKNKSLVRGIVRNDFYRVTLGIDLINKSKRIWLTVTDLAKFLGLSISHFFKLAT
jgi:6-phosphogluconolactonase